MKTSKPDLMPPDFFFRLLPAPLAELAIARITDKTKVTSLKEALWKSFNWAYTKEGFTFWENIHDGVNETGKSFNLKDFTPVIKGPRMYFWRTSTDGKIVNIGCKTLAKSQFFTFVRRLKKFWETGESEGKLFAFEDYFFRPVLKGVRIVNLGETITQASILDVADSVKNYKTRLKNFYTFCQGTTGL